MVNSSGLFATDALSLVATYFLHSSLIVAGAWLLTRWLRSVSFQERIWKWALIAPLATTIAQFCFAAGPAIWVTHPQEQADMREVKHATPHLVRHPMDLGETSEIQTSQPNLHQLGTGSVGHPQGFPTRDMQLRTEPIVLKPTGTTALSEASLSAETWSLRAVVIATIALGIGLSLLRTLVAFLRTRRWLSGATGVSNGDLYEQVNSFAEERRLSRPIDVLIGDCSEPMACGVWRWAIIFPASICDHLCDADLRAIIGHELAHLVRRDPAWLWLGRCVSSLTWFQPLNHFVNGEIARLSEIRCDEWAVERGVRPVVLARCLTRIAEWGQHASLIPSGVNATGGTTLTLSYRVERLLASPTTDRWRSRHWKFAAVVTLTAATPCLVCALPRVAPQSSAPDVSIVSAPLSTDRSSNEAIDNGVESDLAAIVSDLERVRVLLANDPDPELRAAAEALPSRLADLRKTITSGHPPNSPIKELER